ncbi:hypothetical protein ACQUEP_15420 [Enterococcus casseliflavus]|uniref:hypothetical protein n=1 Tax=Enterococcus TaxID=1350 RepID=UPI002250AF57|nr:hypothetical protein [Enterococcus casseliflavus]MCX4167651.1 hypothetical protein [Enterococcus casseliflavus]MDT2987752.1 hypothetical protein [Enterococcus casseliflavus]MDV7702623.1 hypothetical protein [Enterococcus casseliflavus]
MSKLIFVDDNGKRSLVNVSDYCKIELAIQDGKLVNSRMDMKLDFVELKTSENVDKTTKKSMIR